MNLQRKAINIKSKAQLLNIADSKFAENLLAVLTQEDSSGRVCIEPFNNPTVVGRMIKVWREERVLEDDEQYFTRMAYELNEPDLASNKELQRSFSQYRFWKGKIEK